jgi:hypothetical protein
LKFVKGEETDLEKFEDILVQCIDDIKAGGSSIEDCLNRYPSMRDRLEPLLRIALGIREPPDVKPSPSFKVKARVWLMDQIHDGQVVTKWPWFRYNNQVKPIPYIRRFNMARVIPAAVAIVAVVLVVLGVIYGIFTGLPGGTLPGETANFRFLLSDDDSEVTAISDFASVIITVDKIGFHRGGESGNWTEPEDFEPWTGDLLDLIGTNATVLWSGYIEPGNYTKAFIYVSNLTANLTAEAGDGQADIWIPSGKFQITTPFTVTEGGAIVDFVFDITIVKAGKSGQYLIKPQLDKSGPDQEYRLVGEDDSDREIEFKGTILTIADSIWAVNLGAKVWTVNVTGAEIEGTPAVGLKVKIEGMIGEDDIILARKVEVEEVKEKDSDREREFRGTISTISDSIWTVSLGANVWTVNVTGAEIEGTPAVGLKVKIEGIIAEDDVILAGKVEVEEAKEEDPDREREFRGTILTISDSIWTVSQGAEVWTINVTGAEIEGTPAIGLKVMIEGMIGEDDIILASKVEV